MSALVTSQATIDLGRAFKHVKLAFESAKTKKPQFLMRDFSLSFKPKGQATVEELLPFIKPLFTQSCDPEKLPKAKKMVSWLVGLSAAPLSVETMKLVKQVQTELEEARLAQLPEDIGLLLLAKEFASVLAEQLQFILPVIDGSQFIADHMEMSKSEARAYSFKKKPSVAELLNMLSTTDGYAFLLKFPQVMLGQGEIVSETITEEDRLLLQNYIDKASPGPQHYARLLNQLVQANSHMEALVQNSALLSKRNILGLCKHLKSQAPRLEHAIPLLPRLCTQVESFNNFPPHSFLYR